VRSLVIIVSENRVLPMLILTPAAVRPSRHWLSALLLLIALSGCGQKGELYLPERERAELDAGRR
jgi:hypothetical protein